MWGVVRGERSWFLKQRRDQRSFEILGSEDPFSISSRKKEVIQLAKVTPGYFEEPSFDNFGGHSFSGQICCCNARSLKILPTKMNLCNTVEGELTLESYD